MNTAPWKSLHKQMQPLRGGQYSLAKILGIWASVALPMGLIRWVVTPILIPHVDIDPGFLYFTLVTLGLVWEGVVAYIHQILG